MRTQDTSLAGRSIQISAPCRHGLRHVALVWLLVGGFAVGALAEDTVQPDPVLDADHFRKLATQWFNALQQFLPNGHFEPAAAHVLRCSRLGQPEVCVRYGRDITFNFSPEGRLHFFSGVPGSVPGPEIPSFSVEFALREATRILDSIRDLLDLRMKVAPPVAIYCTSQATGDYWDVCWTRQLAGYSYEGEGVSLGWHESRGLLDITVWEDGEECPTEVRFPCEDALARALAVAADAVQRMPVRFSTHKVTEAKLKRLAIVEPNYIFFQGSEAPSIDQRKRRLAYVILVAMDDPKELPVTVWVDAITGEILGGTVKAG